MPRMMLLAATGLAALALTPALAQRGPQGPMTLDQYKAAQKERFDAMDANKDGVVTKKEMSDQIAARMGDTPPAEMVDRFFATIDTDGDGKATAAEAEAAETARFAALDTDHDGTLTPEERRAGMAGMMRRQ